MTSNPFDERYPMGPRIHEKMPNAKVDFYDVREEPFTVYGLYDYKNQPEFVRMDPEVAETLNPGLRGTYRHTTGGRVRFSTDSSFIAIRCHMEKVSPMAHMALSGTSGFDLYLDTDEGGIYLGELRPNFAMTRGYENVRSFRFPEKKMREFTIHFPLYNGVTNLFVGVDEGSAVGPGRKYKHERPVVYYGSSITQGACAIRPGLSYQNIISRYYDCDHINLGFSSGGKGEDAMIEYMSNLDMSIFVSDYDHNTPSTEHLDSSLRKLYKVFREKKPDLPIVLISRPDFYKPPETFDTSAESFIHRDVIYNVYADAFKAGDRNIYYIDGERVMAGKWRECCFIDMEHPNDLGNFRMADVIGDMVGKIFERAEI